MNLHSRRRFLKFCSAAGAAIATGAQSAGGNDGMRMKLVSADAALYTVTVAANAINGALHIISFGKDTSAAGIGIDLVAYNGAWLTGAAATLAASTADNTLTLQ